MNAADAIKLGIETSSMICLSYLKDLSDEDWLRRPCAGCNHINWQVGHLIVSEHNLIEKAVPGSMPALPAGMAEKYTKETAASDDPKSFATKAELMQAYEQQRAGTRAALAKQSDADLDKPSGMEYAPTNAALFGLQASHWLMHSGQWVVVRRQLGRPPLF